MKNITKFAMLAFFVDTKKSDMKYDMTIIQKANIQNITKRKNNYTSGKKALFIIGTKIIDKIK